MRSTFFNPFRSRLSWACVLLGALLMALVAPTGTAHGDGSNELVVIVNRQNATTVVSKEFVRQAFLKQVTRWQDDESIRPADLFAKSATRRQFSEQVLGRSVEAVKSYWQQRVFSGRDIPPPEFATESAVVEYVQQHPGAIGYVSKGVELSTTKVVSVR
jgi:ABC-type phosphate transport system substrate-binding protein